MTNLDPEELSELVSKAQAFIKTVVVPSDREADGADRNSASTMVLARLRTRAWVAGVFAPQAAASYGGLGLNFTDRAAIFEAAGYARSGPESLNVAAPDDRVMHLLTVLATQPQKANFLAPLAAGQTHSAIAVADIDPQTPCCPAPSTTRAEKTTKGWRLQGHKRLICGVDAPGFVVIAAQTSDMTDDTAGMTMFLAAAGAHGMQIRADAAGESLAASVERTLYLDDVALSDEDVIGEVGQGLAALRLTHGPAQLMHVMRSLGSARRAQESARSHIASRPQSNTLHDIEELLDVNEIDMGTARILLLQACRDIDSEDTAVVESRSDVAAEAIARVVDRLAGIGNDLAITYPVALPDRAADVRAATDELSTSDLDQADAAVRA